MAGYVYGKQISDTFLDILERDLQHAENNIQAYLDKQDDPRLTEIVTRLQGIYYAQQGAG
jgi:formate hydrogenlyase subunit 7